ncbi:19371_t:CDS:1, partial [Rhizophagus irregularis]
SYFKLTAEELAKVQQSCVPLNTTRCTEKWVNILNSWQNHQNVGYMYTLESLSSNEQIEKEMCEFLYGVRTKKGDKYSRASLKNAVASISRHLKNSILYWNYNLLDKNSFPKLYATLDGRNEETRNRRCKTT